MGKLRLGPGGKRRGRGDSAGRVSAPELKFVSVPERVAEAGKIENLPESVKATATATGNAAVKPVVVDATITAPLAEAEHYMLRGNEEVTILGVYNVQSGPVQGHIRVDFHEWANGHGAGGGHGEWDLMTLPAEAQA